MVNGTALTPIRTISAVGSTEAAPTASSAFVTPQDHHHFTKARVYFTQPTVGGSGTPTFTATVWGKQGDAIVPLGTSVFTVGTHPRLPFVEIGSVPTAALFVTVAVSGGTTPTITTTAYAFLYNDWEA